MSSTLPLTVISPLAGELNKLETGNGHGWSNRRDDSPLAGELNKLETNVGG